LGELPFVAAGSSAGEKPEAWQLEQAEGVVQVFVLYQRSGVLPWQATPEHLPVAGSHAPAGPTMFMFTSAGLPLSKVPFMWVAAFW
jgi:hypothetical protein